MRIPYFLVRFIIPQAFCHVPILRERTNVYTSTCTSTSAKGIFMTDSSPQTTMSAHTQTGNGTPLAVGDCLVMSVDILHQFRWDKSFISERRVFRTVPIPAGTSVRANKYDSFLIRNLRQIGFNLNPRLGMSAKTMQEINSRTRRSFLSQCRIRSDYYYLDVLVHGRTFH